MKTVLWGKFVALRAYIKNVEKSHTSNITTGLKVQEQKEEKRSRWQDVFKLRAEINNDNTNNNWNINGIE